MPGLAHPNAWRQSAVARFHSCPLSLKFDLEIDIRQLPGEIGGLAARGVLFHRFAAAAINWMRKHREESIPVDVSMELLTRIIAQREEPTPEGDWRPLPSGDVVLLPMEELHWLRVLVTRFASIQRFSIERVVEVEKRLYADIQCVGPDGEPYTRRITGTPDLLIAGPRPDEASLLDWKSGHANPPKRKGDQDSESDDKLSDMGFVQQVVYGWLVMKNFPVINRVTEREWYLMAKEDPYREATVERWQMERIEDILAGVVSQMDAAIEESPQIAILQEEVRERNAVARERNREIIVAARAAERPIMAKDLIPLEDFPYGRMFPIPGTQCGTCVGRRFCPTRETFGAADTLEEAQVLAREWHVAGEIRKERIPYVKAWVDNHGPIPIAHAKGRRVVGYKNGSRSLSMFEPEDAPASPFDAELEAAALEAGVLVDTESP